MKSPQQIADYLARQWRHTDTRLARMLPQPDTQPMWPWDVTIGLPSAKTIRKNIDSVRAHIRTWRNVHIGQVLWEQRRYRDLNGEVALPKHWRLNDSHTWAHATRNEDIQHLHASYAKIFSAVPKTYHDLLLRRPACVRKIGADAIITLTQLATKLKPGHAQGAPLRGLAIEGIDTKFIETHHLLLTELLDIHHDGQVAKQGLEVFLGADAAGGHWLLVVDLDGSLMPVPQCRIRARDLAQWNPPCERLLIVENEQCMHLLPPMPNTLAILGSGRNLKWLTNPSFRHKIMGYWGDIDSWGLVMLANAQKQQPHCQALMMDVATFHHHHNQTVTEPTSVTWSNLPPHTNPEVKQCFETLAKSNRNRLEQECLNRDYVWQTIHAWMAEA